MGTYGSPLEQEAYARGLADSRRERDAAIARAEAAEADNKKLRAAAEPHPRGYDDGWRDRERKARKMAEAEVKRLRTQLDSVDVPGVTCGSCGQVFAEDTSFCPACGWTETTT